MKLKGQLEQAQLENRASDPSNLPDGLLWLNTTANKAKAYIQGATRSLVTEDQPQTLTNKTISAANNTISITPAQLAPGTMSKEQGGTGADNTNVTFPSAGTITTLSASNSWSGANEFTSTVSLDILTDSATTGADQTLDAPTKGIIRLTNASLTSLVGITAPASDVLLVLVNATGSAITIKNDTTATAANRFLTGTAGDLSMANGASLWLVYDAVSARWRVIGGSGGSSTKVSTAQSIPNAGTVSLTNFDAIQVIPASGNAGAATLSATPFGSGGGWVDGLLAEIVGTDDTNTISISYSDTAKGAIGNFETITLARAQAAQFRYLSTLDRWIYVG